MSENVDGEPFQGGVMKTTTYSFKNGVMVRTVTDRPIPTREQMAETARIIRDAARRAHKATRQTCPQCRGTGETRYQDARGHCGVCHGALYVPARNPLPAIDTRAEIIRAIDEGLDVYEVFG